MIKSQRAWLDPARRSTLEIFLLGILSVAIAIWCGRLGFIIANWAFFIAGSSLIALGWIRIILEL